MSTKKSQASQVELKEKCQKCGSSNFVVSKTKDMARYCDNCNHVWGPMTMVELQLVAAKEELQKLKTELEALKQEKKTIFD